MFIDSVEQWVMNSEAIECSFTTVREWNWCSWVRGSWCVFTNWKSMKARAEAPVSSKAYVFTWWDSEESFISTIRCSLFSRSSSMTYAEILMLDLQRWLLLRSTLSLNSLLPLLPTVFPVAVVVETWCRRICCDQSLCSYSTWTSDMWFVGVLLLHRSNITQATPFLSFSPQLEMSYGHLRGS